MCKPYGIVSDLKKPSKLLYLWRDFTVKYQYYVQYLIMGSLFFSKAIVLLIWSSNSDSSGTFVYIKCNYTWMLNKEYAFIKPGLFKHLSVLWTFRLYSCWSIQPNNKLHHVYVLHFGKMFCNRVPNLGHSVICYQIWFP